MKLRRLLLVLGMVGMCLPGSAAPTKPTLAPPADAFALKPLEWIPPFPTPRLLPVHFPRESPMAAVEHLEVAGQRLWLAARSRLNTNLAVGTGRLWVFSPDLNLLQAVPGAISNNVVNGLLGHDRRLWLAVEGGVGALELTTWSVEGYDQTRGVGAGSFAGLARVADSLVAFSRNGTLFTLPAGEASFARSPGTVPRIAEPWTTFAASARWVLAAAGTNVVTRNLQGPQWLAAAADLDRGSPRLSPAQVRCSVGDGEGGFWLGTDAGLHWLDSETGQTENRFAPPPLRVSGGLGVTAAPGYQLTAAAYRQAQDRVMNGVRDRMRDRARRARARQEGRKVGSWVEPSSRLPGAVTALLSDQTWLWVACADPMATPRSRVLLYHRPSRRWVGWFPLGLPVRSLAADGQYLWVGLEDSRAQGLPVLVAVDRLPLLALPPGRWVREPIAPEELGTRLAALNPKERATYAFFADEPAQVVALLAPDGVPRPDADAESLFLLAFAHDSLGLNQPEKFDAYLGRLRQAHPQSLFTELAAQVHIPRAQPAPASDEIAAPAETPESVLERRDLNGDGKLNAVELRLWRGPEAPLGAHDRNGDGALDLAEVRALLSE